MKVGPSATCYSDGFGARLRHLFLDTCKLVCLIKSATPASVIGVNGRWSYPRLDTERIIGSDYGAAKRFAISWILKLIHYFITEADFIRNKKWFIRHVAIRSASYFVSADYLLSPYRKISTDDHILIGWLLGADTDIFKRHRWLFL